MTRRENTSRNRRAMTPSTRRSCLVTGSPAQRSEMAARHPQARTRGAIVGTCAPKNGECCLSWCERAMESGARAHVVEIIVHGSCILVGLTLAATEGGTGVFERWRRDAASSHYLARYHARRHSISSLRPYERPLGGVGQRLFAREQLSSSQRNDHQHAGSAGGAVGVVGALVGVDTPVDVAARARRARRIGRGGKSCGPMPSWWPRGSRWSADRRGRFYPVEEARTMAGTRCPA